MIKLIKFGASWLGSISKVELEDKIKEYEAN